MLNQSRNLYFTIFLWLKTYSTFECESRNTRTVKANRNTASPPLTQGLRPAELHACRDFPKFSSIYRSFFFYLTGKNYKSELRNVQ